MDFGSGGNRDVFYQEDESMINNNNRSGSNIFPFSSPSSVSSSSSPHYRGFFPLSNDRGIYSNTHHHLHQEEEELALATTNNGASTSTSSAIEKEHMFDKVVTPSDVGKLNRLVIPKQHAEKYFPLDSSTNEKGLLLNFEDRTGKPWRFRYSYWNSSQSYVMTKGWSRFVKEKKLDAGDIVSFQRGLGDQGIDRLFIDWRRRQNGPQFDHHTSSGFGFHRSTFPRSPMFLRPPPGAVVQFSHQPNNFSTFHPDQNQSRYSHYYYNSNVNPCPGSIMYLRSATAQVQEGGGGGVVDPMVFDSVPVVQGKTTSKKLRLFGVNMECGVSSESNSTDDHHQPNNATAMMMESHESNIPFTTLQSTRLYNGIPVKTDQFLNKGMSSSMSLDLDI